MEALLINNISTIMTLTMAMRVGAVSVKATQREVVIEVHDSDDGGERDEGGTIVVIKLNFIWSIDSGARRLAEAQVADLNEQSGLVFCENRAGGDGDVSRPEDESKTPIGCNDSPAKFNS